MGSLASDPYLALPTRGTIHSRIQLGVTGGPHRAPERVADILQEKGTGHALTASQCHHLPCPLATLKVSWAPLLGAGLWRALQTGH